MGSAPNGARVEERKEARHMTYPESAPAPEDDQDRRLAEPRAESYKFTTEGDTLKGTVRRLELGDTAYGPCRIVVVDTPDGPRSVWLIHDALLSQMRKLRPEPGDRIGIRYNGRQQSGAGRSYHSYTVVTDRDAAGFSWDEEPARQPAVDPWATDGDGVPLPSEPPF